MKIIIKHLAFGLCALSLSACTSIQGSSGADYPDYVYDPGQTYPIDNNRLNQYINENPAAQEVTVPETYHVGAYHAPVSFKDRDRQWVQGQNPQRYTIEVADDEKAADVAQKLHKLPKNDRVGQVHYQRAGKSYYKGLYGSYDSQEAAQKALDALPADLKQNAGVKNWGSVQNNVQ
jgi:septal ring-binding cell division protein DamX